MAKLPPSFIKIRTCAGAVATGTYDLSAVAYENYQRYVVRGEDFHLMTAVFDTVRVGLDVLSIKAGVKGLTDSTRICFVAGTLVATAEGRKLIEEIQVGDEVLSQDVKTGEVAIKQVTQIFENETSELVHVHVDGEIISTTPEHPFYVAKFGWVSAIKLRAGDVLVLSNGEYVVVEQIQHEILESPVKVYNFEVEDFHTYFVGENSVLVHNSCGGNANGKYDPRKPMNPSNYPNPDPDFSSPPVRYEPKTIDEVKRMRSGKGPTTKATHGNKNIEAHHRGQKSIKKGGVFDDLEEYTHRGAGNHKRHNQPSQLSPAQRAGEIRSYWKNRGGEYILPGEGI